MATQRAFVVKGDTASLQDVPVPKPGADECVVRVLIAGVCNTDLEIMKGYMGFAGVVGHVSASTANSIPPSSLLSHLSPLSSTGVCRRV